jgi:hypothetical protein
MNVRLLSTDYTASHPKRRNLSQPPLREPQILQVVSYRVSQTAVNS